MKRRLAVPLSGPLLCGAHARMCNLGPSKAGAGLKLALNAMAAASRKWGYCAVAGILPCGVHEGMCSPESSKASPDFELAPNAMAVAKRKLVGYYAEASR